MTNSPVGALRILVPRDAYRGNRLGFHPSLSVMAALLGAVMLLGACDTDPTGPADDDPIVDPGPGPFQGLFVAAGDERLLFSSDGVAWEDVSSFGGSSIDLAGRRIVDVVAERRRLIFTDSLLPEVRRLRGDPEQVDETIGSEPILAVAAGDSLVVGMSRKRVFTSTDGLEFSPSTGSLEFPPGGLLVDPDLVSRRGRFVAALTFRDSEGRIRVALAASRDGELWETTNVWRRLGFNVDLFQDDRGFLALGVLGSPESGSRMVWTSEDGLTWAERPFDDLASPTPRSVARGDDGRIVVLGRSDTGVYRWHSDNGGETWSEGHAVEGGEDVPLDLMHVDGWYYAVLESGRIMTSADGETWGFAPQAGDRNGALRTIHYVK